MKTTRHVALATVVLATLAPTAAHAVVTFEQAALDAGYTYGSTGTIDVGGENIDTLTGVNKFTAATSVEAYGNYITGIATDQFSGMTNLRKLWLYHNQIISIESGDFSGLGNLQELKLDYNQIISIESGSFSGLGNLTSLRLHSNQIGSIESGDFSGLDNLQSLSLQYNQISSIESGDFSGLGNLRQLYLHNNQISSIESGDFSGLGNLIFLNLVGNQISSIESGDFSGLDNLQSLHLSFNPISSIESGDFSGLGNLRWLSLVGNHMSSIGDDAFDGMTSLLHLDLYYNNLTHLNLSGADFGDLQTFYVSGGGNSVSSVDLSGASLSDGAFQTLISALLDDCAVTTMELRSADLSAVADLSPMYGLHDLVTLDLAYAKLPDLDALDELVAELEPYALDDLTLSWDQWTPMDPGTQTYLTDWDAMPANTLTIVPEPATWVLLALALPALGLLPRRRSLTTKQAECLTTEARRTRRL